MSSDGRVEHQWQNAGIGLEDVVEESMSETSFEQQPPPRHPIPTMQGAFEESILEEPEESTLSKKDSVFRRKILLERPQYQRIVGSKWTQKPGEKFHPLWKLVSQLAFGMHLLHQELAKSEEEVIKILQTHVDEVDGFLERTTEDFDLAQHDINERIRYLQLPLEHGEVFDTMLMDRAFRTAMVEGNIKIEHIVDRTAMALTDSLKDVKKGSDGTKELARYLRRLEKTWYVRDDTITEVFHAMMGNTEGWTAALQGLQEKGKLLNKSLEHLRAIIAEIQRLVGIASRRNVPQQYTPLVGQYSRSTTTSRSPPRSRSPEDNDIITSSFATMSNDSSSRKEQEPKETVHEGRNWSPPALHANAILEEEEESDHFSASSYPIAEASARTQAPILINKSDRTFPEDDVVSLGNHATSQPHTQNLTQDDRTDLKYGSGVSALGAIANVVTESNATVSISRSQLHDDAERLIPRPSGRAPYVPRPEVIEEEDEDSDDSGYTADVIGSAPITSMVPIPSPVEDMPHRFPSHTDQANELHEIDQVPDYIPPKIEFRSSIPKPAETEVNEATKEFVLPPLNLESETPLPALTPLDYERMRAGRIIPAFDLKVPEEYIKSNSPMEIKDSESKATTHDLPRSKSIETMATESDEIRLQTTNLEPTNIEKPKNLLHPFQGKDSVANSIEQTMAAHSIVSSIDHNSSPSLDDATPISIPLAEQRNVYREEESPRSAYTEIPWSPEFENDDAISYTDQYVPRPDHLIPDHLLPPRSDSLNLNSDQFVPHPDQFYQDSKRSSGQFIPHPDQFYQDSRSEYSVKMGLLTSDIPKTAEFAVHAERDKISDSSSSTSEGQLVDDMKTPVQNSHAIFPVATTGLALHERESPPSEDEQPFPLPPHADVFTRTQSMSKDIHRKPVPRPQQREAPKSNLAKQVPAASLGIAPITATTAIAVNETAESDTPTLTKGPRQLPIDDLLIRLRHGAGLVTPTEPDPKPDPTIDSLLRETEHSVVGSPDKRDGEADNDLLISPGTVSTALQLGSEQNKELPLKQHEDLEVTHQANAEPMVRSIQLDPFISVRTAEPNNFSIQGEPVIHSVQLEPKDGGHTSVHKDRARSETSQMLAEPYAQQQHQGAGVNESTPKISEPPAIGIVPIPEATHAPKQDAGQLKPDIEAQRELSPPQINVQHEQLAPAISRRPAILEPRLQRRASYSDNRTTQRISALQQSGFVKNGLLSPEFANLSPKQYPHSALVPASSPWTFFSKDDMDHSYRRRRAHSLYSPATPYDLEWLLRRTPSDMAVSPMRWSEIYGWRSGQSSAVSPLGYPFGGRSNLISPMKQDLSIDSVLNGTKPKPAQIEAPLAPTARNPNLILNDLDAVRGQLSQAADVKPIQPAWREPTLREQKADRPTIRASSIYSKAPDLDLEYSPPTDLPRIVRTETGYESYYGQTQPSSAYTDMTFGQISPAPAISSAKPSPLHFISRDRIPDAPESPGSPKEEPKFPLEISDEKQTVVEVPPISPSLKSLTSATVTGPEPDFPFLSATYSGPAPDYYYYSTSFDEPEEIPPRSTNSELATPNAAGYHSKNERRQQENGIPQPSATDYNENEQQQVPTEIDDEDPTQSSQPGSFPTAYRQNSVSKRREGPPPALNLKLFPSMDSISRAAISPRSPRPQDLIAESGRSMVTLPVPNLSTSSLMPPGVQEQAAPITAQKPNRSPLKKLFKDALSPSLLSSRLKRDKGHRRGRSSVEKSLAKDATIANAQITSGMAQQHGSNESSDTASLFRKGSMPVMSDGRRPSGERILYGMPGSDGHPF